MPQTSKKFLSTKSVALRGAVLGDSSVLQEIHELRAEGRLVRARAMYWAYVYDFVSGQLAADAGLARSVCIVRYEDLCTDSLETIDRIVKHAELDPEPFAGVRAAYAQKLSFPEYYRPDFGNRELADIVDVTQSVATRFGYDVPSLARRAAQPA